MIEYSEWNNMFVEPSPENIIVKGQWRERGSQKLLTAQISMSRFAMDQSRLGVQEHLDHARAKLWQAYGNTSDEPYFPGIYPRDPFPLVAGRYVLAGVVFLSRGEERRRG